MSVYDDAILITYPSGVKVGKVYSQKPTDGTGDYTFSRSTTATRVNASGVIVSAAIDEPRIDYTGGGCGVALIEAQATNNINYSEDLGNSNWTKNNSVVTINSITSPDGTTNASLVVGNSASQTGTYIRVNATSATSSGSTYTLSAYVKPKGNSEFLKVWARNTSASSVVFNLVTGTTNSPSISTIDAVNNGWFKVTTTGVLSGASVAPYFYVYYSSSENEGFYIWGTQIEEGANASSYIPTNGTTVTKVADICQVTTPTGVTSITETVSGVDTVITTIPTTYSLPIGRVETILME